MAGEVSTVFLVLFGAVIAVNVYTSDPGSVFKQTKGGVVKESIDTSTVDAVAGEVKLKFYFKGKGGINSAGDGPWNMTAYASLNDNPYGTAETGQILSEDDSHQGDNVDFISEPVTLQGMSGCPNPENKSYACYLLSKGDNSPVWSECEEIDVPCALN